MPKILAKNFYKLADQCIEFEGLGSQVLQFLHFVVVLLSHQVQE